jgi:hypothetical protein
MSHAINNESSLKYLRLQAVWWKKIKIKFLFFGKKIEIISEFNRFYSFFDFKLKLKQN